IEKLLTANTWHGVLFLKSAPFPPGIICEELTFRTDKSANLTKCDATATQDWKVTDSANVSYLTILNTVYSIEKLTTDTLMVREKSNSRFFLFLKNFSGYNRVMLYRTFENGAIGGTFGLDCADIEKSEIPEYNFKIEASAPNPASYSSTIGYQIGAGGTSIKITIDDGQSEPNLILDNISVAGNFTLQINLDNKKPGVYRISYVVKPPNQTAKTIYSYIYVFK
ncbi:MAG: hypothetical protein JST20_12425, partial [Bacteroidetes bacterium]|nr:hypothetical protein [Bacteroidota bacterium]